MSFLFFIYISDYTSCPTSNSNCEAFWGHQLQGIQGSLSGERRTLHILSSLAVSYMNYNGINGTINNGLTKPLIKLRTQNFKNTSICSCFQRHPSGSTSPGWPPLSFPHHQSDAPWKQNERGLALYFEKMGPRSDEGPRRRGSSFDHNSPRR